MVRQITISDAKSSHFLPDSCVEIVMSCQFAMHYSWSTEARARRALANISALLRPGGIFIGTMPDANVIVKKYREGLTFAQFCPACPC
ncbi:hypothetical protein KY285_035427 [Solanum tuberosum]|nr:hypothetical protein KY285_035427 [Solanum tuberosum]